MEHLSRQEQVPFIDCYDLLLEDCRIGQPLLTEGLQVVPDEGHPLILLCQLVSELLLVDRDQLVAEDHQAHGDLSFLALGEATKRQPISNLDHGGRLPSARWLADVGHGVLPIAECLSQQGYRLLIGQQLRRSLLEEAELMIGSILRHELQMRLILWSHP